MARTHFKGPVYGAKSLLAAFSKDTVAVSQTDLEIFQIDVPSGENWYITSVDAYCDDQGSAAASLDVEDDGATILTGALTLVSDDSVEGSLVAVSAGEDEGVKVAGGSVLTVDATTGATTAPADIMVNIYGFIRRTIQD